MQHVQMNELLYREAQRRATEAGFSSVDEYVAEVVAQDLSEETDNYDHLFTPERLSHIDKAAAAIRAGHGYTAEQADAELAKRRRQWIRENPR